MDRAELIAQLQKNPTDGHVLVYADWLQAQGDPLGEHIGLSSSPDQEAARERLREKYPRAILGDLDPRVEGLRLTWKRGLIASAELDGAIARSADGHRPDQVAKLPLRLTSPGALRPRTVRLLLQAPASILLRSIMLARVNNVAELMREVNAHRPPTLERVELFSIEDRGAIAALKDATWLRELALIRSDSLLPDLDEALRRRLQKLELPGK